jgi:predicted ATP-grasp superfamily ATP-dependent carboligase
MWNITSYIWLLSQGNIEEGVDMYIETDRANRLDRQTAIEDTLCDVLLTDASSRQSLVAMRSLGERGLRVAAFENTDYLPAPAFSSRWCRYKATCSADEGTPESIAHLEQVLDSTQVRVLIASSDATVEMARQHRERLEQHVRVALAKTPALAVAVNKERTLSVARRLGLGVPRAVTVGSANEVGTALREIGLPAVVKPVESWVWNKQQGMRIISRLVTTQDEARQAVDELTSFGGSVLFQEFLSGRREAISFFYANGQMHARFAQWAKRTNPPLGGTSVLRQSIAIPSDIGEQAERLVREIKLEGYSEVEFRRDSQGCPYLMEINPRLSASVELAVRAGVDFPYLLYQWAMGERIDVVKDYRVGIWMRYLGGDIATTIAALRQRGRPGITPPVAAIADFFLSFLMSMNYDYLDWKDLYPMISAMVGFPRYLWQRGKRHATKSKAP